MLSQNHTLFHGRLNKHRGIICGEYFHNKVCIGVEEGKLMLLPPTYSEKKSPTCEEDWPFFMRQVQAKHLALVGYIKRAKEVAQKIKNDYWRSLAYCEISIAQAAVGDIDGADDTIDQIDDTYWMMRSKALIRLRYVLAARLFPKDIRDRKKVPIVKAKDFDWYSKMVAELLLAFASYEKIQQAKELAIRDMQNVFERSELFVKIVKIQASSGKIKNAQETAEEISVSCLRSKALVEIAKAQIALEDIAGAEETLKKITDVKMYSEVQVEIVKIQASLGDIDSAKQIAIGIVDEYWRLMACIEIAKFQAVSGHLSDAKNTINTFSAFKDKWCLLAYQEITQALIDSGKIKEAKEAIQEIENQEEHFPLLHNIAVAQATSEDIVGGMQTASEIKDHYWRTKTYCNLYSILQKR